MTVNPGFGGQAYIATMEPKVAEVRRLVDERGLDVDVEVDGGIGPDTVAGAAAAGANVLVAGSALYRDPEGLEHAVTELRERAEAARAAETGSASRRGGGDEPRRRAARRGRLAPTWRSTAGSPPVRQNTKATRSTGRPVACSTATAYAAPCSR